MAEQPKILKVEVTSSIGFSIQTEDGDWVKSGVSLNTHIGPGYPPQEMLKDVLNGMVLSAYEGSADQVNLLIAKVNERAGRNV
jgi:hypothetical protein